MPLLTQYQTFFVSPFGEASVTSELNTFLRSHRIVNLEKRLVDGERGTGWLFLVEYATTQAQGAGSAPSPRVDWREQLTETEFAIFDHLRSLRKTVAEQQGIPVYNVFTNEQLAAMACKPPRSLKDLNALPGVGEGRVRQFGPDFLTFFSNSSTDPSNADISHEPAPAGSSGSASSVMAVSGEADPGSSSSSSGQSGNHASSGSVF
ncbi:MAG: HRDC domain-containing protein [Spirochaetota bacterium]